MSEGHAPRDFVNEYKPPIPPDLEPILNPPSTPESLAAASRMTGVDRLEVAFRLKRIFTERIKADILAAHPDWTKAQRFRAFVDYMFGPDAPPPDFELPVEDYIEPTLFDRESAG